MHSVTELISGSIESLNWIFDKEKDRYVLDLQPFFIFVVWRAKNKQGLQRWYSQMVGCQVIDWFEEFETPEECKFFTITTAQSLFVSIQNHLKEQSKELH